MDDDDFLNFGDEEEFKEEKIVCSRCGTEIDKYQRREDNFSYCKKCKTIVPVVKEDEFTEDTGNSLYKVVRNDDVLEIEVCYYEKGTGVLALSGAFVFFALSNIVSGFFLNFVIYLIIFISLFMGIVGLFDKIHIIIDDKYIYVKSLPFPSYFKDKKFPLKDIYQIFVGEPEISYSGRGRIRDLEQGAHGYVLNVMYMDRKVYPLLPVYSEVSYLPDLERIIEDFLGIEDKKLLNEYRYKR